MPTVLIADDDADHVELLAIVLRRHGHEVVTATDAATAHRLLRTGDVDAALLDVRLPAESGIELCRRLRDDPRTAALPILLVSADVTGARVAAGLAAGADDYIAKPFHRAELLARLDSVISRTGLTAGGAARLGALGAVPGVRAARAPEPAVARTA